MAYPLIFHKTADAYERLFNFKPSSGNVAVVFFSQFLQHLPFIKTKKSASDFARQASIFGRTLVSYINMEKNTTIFL